MIRATIVFALCLYASLAVEEQLDEENEKNIESILDVFLNHSCSGENLCSHHGECLIDDICICKEGYSGKICENVPSPDQETVSKTDEEDNDVAFDWLNANDIETIIISWPTRTGITKQEAEEKCEKVLLEENPFKEICEKRVLNIREVLLPKCVRSIKIVSQLNAAYSMLPDYVTDCLLKVKENL